MKTTLRVVISCLAVFVVLILGCGNIGPSNSTITQLVSESMVDSVPTDYTKTLMPGSKAVISEIKVVNSGDKQKLNNTTYWPAKVYAKGTCVAILTNEISFEGESEYYFWKDPYGEWKVTHRKENIGK